MITFDEIKPLLKTIARENFWAFCCYYDWEFFYIKRRFLKQVAIAFQQVIDEYKQGNALKVAVKMPPRSGKSYITSLFSAFWLAQFPELSVMRNCCTSTLYQKFSYDARNIIRSQKFNEVFPNIEIMSDKQNLDGWSLKTSKQVGYFGAGVGGSIIGFGANIAISDDLYKSMQDALSSATNSNVKLWKESAHNSRMEKNCPEIFIGTRWAKSDIIGEAMENKLIDIDITIPALIDANSFCEDVKSTEEYIKIKEQTSSSTWSAEYMQEPVEIEGLLLPKESLKFADLSNIDVKNIQFRFAVGDPADTGGDKFSMPFIDVVFFEDKFAFYVRDIIHNPNGIEANAERVIDKCKKHLIEQVFIESNGVGLAAVLLVNKIKSQHLKLSPIVSSENKEVRILSHFEFVRDYFIFDSNYESNPEYKMFINDACGYVKEGDNKHKKDAIDVLCLAANILKVKYSKIIYGK